MKPRFPLFLKIVVWFVLNLLVLGVVGLMILEGRFGSDLLWSGPVTRRVSVVSEGVLSELRARPGSEWRSILDNHSANYGVRFLLFEDDGSQVDGEPTLLPEPVRERLKGPGHRPGPERPPPPFELRFQAGFTNNPFPHFPSRPRFVLRTSSPPRYWIGVPAILGTGANQIPHFCTLIIQSRNLYGGGLFFDAKPLVAAAAWVLLFSVLFWLPLVRGITRSLSRMMRATQTIAEGQFEARVSIPRRDELGQLGTAINVMAQRLEGFVTGQKRFLGDTAHELCTPLARIQMAVGILEQRAGPEVQAYVQDVREEVQHMSELVAELLSFSKASLAKGQIKLQPVRLRDRAEEALQRESQAGADVRLEIDSDLEAIGDPDLFQRALANLLRNAIRYAGTCGPIMVTGAKDDNGSVILKVTDSGPGVPDAFLSRLFDPFFRVEEARTREGGGVGLGLTIVRTCIEACGGSVFCRNSEPSGLEVVIRLNAPPRATNGGTAESPNGNRSPEPATHA